MKAVDLVIKYRALIASGKDDADAVTDVLLLIVKETEDLVKQRKCHSNDAYRAVFKEQNNKWKVAVKLEPKMIEKLYQCAVHETWPKIYEFLVKDKVFNEH